MGGCEGAGSKFLAYPKDNGIRWEVCREHLEFDQGNGEVSFEELVCACIHHGIIKFFAINEATMKYYSQS